VMTDDQTVEDMRVMSQTKALLGDKGTTFENSFVNFPLCCPSRATLFTGQYAHNHGVLSGRGFKDLDSSNTLPVWLRDAGYTTAHVGKYLNGYGDENQGGRMLVPPGWSEWYATLPDAQAVYDYDLNENGNVVHYGTAAEDFKGDVITDKALDFIGRNAAAESPFFLSVAYTAPHGVGAEPNEGQACQSSAKPAPRHIGAFDSEPLPSPSSFNEADVSDKHQAVRDKSLIGDSRISVMTRQHRCRLASLLHVDEGVAGMVAALRDAGVLDHTQIIFTSDNGFFLGEHRIDTGKVHAYEESSRVPLLMRGPGVPAGHAAQGFAVNADIAPTILEAANVTPGLPQDGKSLFDVIGAGDRARDVLIENHIANPDVGWTPYMAVRTRRYLYVEYSTGERELFDLQVDPHQLESRHADPAYDEIRERLDLRLEELRACSGSSCRQPAGPGSAPAAPVLSGTDPPSGANENAPRVQGSAPAGSTVDLFANDDCSGTPAVDDAPAADLDGPGIAIAVADNSTTPLSAMSSDGVGDSSCSNSISYSEVTPPPPASGGDAPPPPAGGSEPVPADSGISDSGGSGEVSPTEQPADFALGREKRNSDGSVSLVVRVEEPGSVSADDALVSGATTVGRRSKVAGDRVKRAIATASSAGPIKLRLQPTKLAKRKLKRRRSLEARVEVTFTPTDGAAASEKTTIKLKAPRRKR
jgi:N-acetylglucosamine-6-sulfatase